MKSYWIKSEGAGTALELRDVPVPQPNPRQLLLHVRAASINRGEVLAGISHHRANVAHPAGGDAAGEVHAVGEGVTSFKPGDSVIARARGSFAEYVLADVEQVAAKPQRLSWEQAAAVPVVFVTAYEALLGLGHLKQGEWLLIAGASSGVGVACLQAAKCIGAKVIGVSRSAEKLAKLKTLGLDVGIPARGRDFASQALEVTGGKGVDLAVDLVGGSVFSACQRALANHGRLAVVGYVDGVMKAEIDLEAVHGRRLRIFGVSNAALTAAQRAGAMRGFVRDLLPALADGRIVPLVDRVFPFDELPAAKAYVESDALLGKVVVKME